MRHIIGYACTALVLIAGLTACQNARTASAPTASTVTGAEAAKGAELYGAGLFTTGAWDFFMAFTPDQTDVFFCRANDTFSTYDIFETRLGADGHWTAPSKPGFAAQWSNADPHVSPDGNTVFFISNRPPSGKPGEPAVPDTYDIWFAEREKGGTWGAAQRLPAPVNDIKAEKYSPSVARNGNLYFGTVRAGGRGASDLWIARRVNGVYQTPENLGEAINTAGDEVEPWIAPDESYLIFSALHRADSIGGYDLYVSRKVGGSWEKARLVTGGINTPAREFNQSVSPDGKWLYFSSDRRYTGPLGERFDTPRDERAVTGIGDGKRGDIYRIAISELNIAGGSK